MNGNNEWVPRGNTCGENVSEKAVLYLLPLFLPDLKKYIHAYNKIFDTKLEKKSHENTGKSRIVASTSPSRFEARAGLFRWLMKGIFDPYLLWSFEKKVIF